jgi:acyl dehydratase
MLLKAASSRKKPPREPVFRPLVIAVQGVRVDQDKLHKFCRVCGFSARETLPMTYPHVVAFALQLQALLEPEFPFSPLGAVHVRNRIRQQRSIHQREVLDFSVHLGNAQQVAKGYEVEIVTEVRVGSELVWDELSVMLVRKGGSGSAKLPANRQATDYAESTTWNLPADLGRRYAAVSGDYNPIHLYPLSARLMGFKRQIIHGMWGVSRAIAQLISPDNTGPASVDVSFKLPIFLPATVTFLSHTDATGSRFAVRDSRAEKPHMVGELTLG